MVEDSQHNDAYKKRVREISLAVDDTHCPQAAVDLVQQNDWNAAKGVITPLSFDEYSLGLIPSTYFDKLSPRQRVAFDTICESFMAFSDCAYFIGRALKQEDLFLRYSQYSPLDHIVSHASNNNCASFSARKAYELEFPVSSTLDKLFGGIAGLVVSPLAFVVGLGYTPKKEKTLAEVTN